MKKKKYYIFDLTSRYILGLSLLALLSILAYFSLKQVIETQEKSGLKVNMSGRQRMLSQRIALFSHLLLENEGKLRNEVLRELLEDNISLMEKSHNFLINGNHEMTFLEISPAIKAIYFNNPINLDKEVRLFIKNVKKLIQIPDSKLHHKKSVIIELELTKKGSKLLRFLDIAVNQYQKENEYKINKLYKVEKTVLIVTLLTLLFEAFFIFSPIVKKITKQTHKLIISQKKLKAVINTVGEGIITIDANNKILNVNEEVKKIWSCNKDSLINKDLKRIIRYHSEENSNSIKGLLITDSIIGKRHECNGIKNDGTIFPLEICITETKNDGNLFFTAAVRDISERKLAELKIKSKTEELKQNNKEIKSYTYIISHDLRAPLVNLIGFSMELKNSIKSIEEIITKNYPSESEEKDSSNLLDLLKKDVPESLKFIELSTKKMDSLISSILKLARLGQRKVKLEFVDINEVVQFHLATVAHQIEKANVKVSVENLPKIFTDRLSLEQIIGNLFNNAIKFFEPGQPALITMSATTSEEEITFTIKDTGPGISERDQEKIFDIFQRAGKQNTPGEGMGLTYVRRMIQKLGGKIWCKSKIGVGTSFIFTLPVLKDKEL